VNSGLSPTKLFYTGVAHRRWILLTRVTPAVSAAGAVPFGRTDGTGGATRVFAYEYAHPHFQVAHHR